MHFEILVEDTSGSLLLQPLLTKILGANGGVHSWRMHAYRGIGRVPHNLRGKADPWKRILLDQLPRILAGYGKSLPGDSAVVIVVDLDNRNCISFKQELLRILGPLHPKPRTLFRFAIEETEAWLLGDTKAVLKAFPRAKVNVLNSYVQDSICGTWETLADAVFPGGAAKLRPEGYPRIGVEKCKWASLIGQHTDIGSNRSPSFQVFRKGLLRLTQGEETNPPGPAGTRQVE